MSRVAAAAVAAAALATAAPAATPLPRLPAPSFSVPGQLTAFAASGPRVAVATGCAVRVADLVRGTAPVRIRPIRGDCASDPGDSWVTDLRLGAATMAATTILAPSPHGEAYSVFTGPLHGPLHALADGWGWRDDDVPHGSGCAWSVAAGAGAVALTKVPNTLAVDQGLESEPACPAGPTATIRLQGAARPQLTLPGSWSILALDGKRLALARLGVDGAPTGELSLLSVSGARLAPPHVAAADVRTASQGWLTPQGLVLSAKRGLVGPGWVVTGVGANPTATAAEGRVFYLKRRTIHVRRIQGGADRALLLVPTVDSYLGAGSFGLAVAVGGENRSQVYRVPWRTIDRVLPAR